MIKRKALKKITYKKTQKPGFINSTGSQKRTL